MPFRTPPSIQKYPHPLFLNGQKISKKIFKKISSQLDKRPYCPYTTSMEIKPYAPSTGFYASKAALSSIDDTWATPRDYYEKVAKEFNFKLDAAALQSSTLVGDNWYGPDHPDETRRDAFLMDWTKDSEGGVVWLNPPYGKTIKQWMKKAYDEAKRGATVVCLVPSRTDTAWFHEYCIDHEVRFIRGRLKFGAAVNPAPFPSALVIMKPSIG